VSEGLKIDTVVLSNSKASKQASTLQDIEESLSEAVLENTQCGHFAPSSRPKWAKEAEDDWVLWSGLVRVFMSQLWLQEFRNMRMATHKTKLPKKFLRKLFSPQGSNLQTDGEWKSGYAEITRHALQIVVSASEDLDPDSSLHSEAKSSSTCSGDVSSKSLEILIPLDRLLLHEPMLKGTRKLEGVTALLHDPVTDYEKHIDGFLCKPSDLTVIGEEQGGANGASSNNKMKPERPQRKMYPLDFLAKQCVRSVLKEDVNVVETTLMLSAIDLNSIEDGSNSVNSMSKGSGVGDENRIVLNAEHTTSNDLVSYQLQFTRRENRDRVSDILSRLFTAKIMEQVITWCAMDEYEGLLSRESSINSGSGSKELVSGNHINTSLLKLKASFDVAVEIDHLLSQLSCGELENLKCGWCANLAQAALAAAARSGKPSCVSILISKYEINCDGDTSPSATNVCPLGKDFATDSKRFDNVLLRKFCDGTGTDDSDSQTKTAASKDDEYLSILKDSATQIARNRKSMEQLGLCSNRLFDLRSSQTLEALSHENARGSSASMRSLVCGDPPLVLACQRLTPSHAKCVDILLQEGADISIGGNNGRTPLHAACTAASASFVDDKDRERASDVERPTSMGSEKSCTSFLYNRSTCTREPTRSPTPSLFFKKTTSVDRVSNGSKGAIPFSFMTTEIELDCLKVVKDLLRRGANPQAPDAEGVTPLMVATMMGDSGLEVCRELVQFSTNYNLYENSQLFRVNSVGPRKRRSTTWKGKEQHSSAFVNCQAWSTGFSALHYAAGRNSLRCVSFLLTSGASPFMRTADHQTALHLAAKAFHDNFGCMEELLTCSGNCSINAVDKHGKTPLMYLVISAVRRQCNTKERLRALKSMLAKGATVNAKQQSTGKQVLHFAVPCADMIEALLNAGADINAKDHSGRTPLDVVEQNFSSNSLDDFMSSSYLAECAKCKDVLLLRGALQRLQQAVPIETDTKELKFARNPAKENSYHLVAATLPALMQRLVSGINPSVTEMRSWLFMHQAFVPSTELLEILMDILTKWGIIKPKSPPYRDCGKRLRGTSHPLIPNEVVTAEGGSVLATATWGYTANEKNELTFSQGDEIHVDIMDESGWWTGHCEGRQGCFPANRVKLVEEDAHDVMEKQQKMETALLFMEIWLQVLCRFPFFFAFLPFV
jgi:ankyrin repeat protein